jgi:hypothetical protein
MRSGRRFLPRSRLMTGVFLAFNAGMLWWFLGERHRFDRCLPPHCPSPLKLASIVTAWMFGTLFLSLLWLMVERRLGLRSLERAATGRDREAN